MGPGLFVVNASGLRVSVPKNELCKYADDTYLLVPSSNTHTVSAELHHIAEWASLHNLKLNPSKTSEMIVHRPKINADLSKVPTASVGIVRVSSMVILGVEVSSTLTFSQHVNRIISQCGQVSYALRLLVSRGLSGPHLWDVAKATLIPKITYALPCWWGFLDAADRNKLSRVITRAKRGRLLPENYPSIEEMSNATETVLFRNLINNPSHVLAQLLPPLNTSAHFLRKRVHNRSIPRVTDSILRKNFIFRHIFNDTY